MKAPYHRAFRGPIRQDTPWGLDLCHRGLLPDTLFFLPGRVKPARSLLGLALLAALGGGLVITNPDEREFERFAADQVTLAAQEAFCRDGGLPLLAHLVLRDCSRLIASQHDLLGKLALTASRRRQFGILSLYQTDLGGYRLLPDWGLPRYRALTLAMAGRFLILHSSAATGAEASSTAAAP